MAGDPGIPPRPFRGSEWRASHADEALRLGKPECRRAVESVRRQPELARHYPRSRIADAEHRFWRSDHVRALPVSASLDGARWRIRYGRFLGLDTLAHRF